jgi:glucoamylase
MINQVQHNPDQYDIRREPLFPTQTTVPVDIYALTAPVESGQSVWICYQEFDDQGNIIPDASSVAIVPDSPPNPLHYVQCNWLSNSGDRSYWRGRIGPFTSGAIRVIYTIFARQGTNVITISSPDFFSFDIAGLVPNTAPTYNGNTACWASGAKDGYCTAYNDLSRVWCTLSKGTINEIYFPRLDKPNSRDFQFLVLDANGKFIDPKKSPSEIEYLDVATGASPDGLPRSLGYRVKNGDPAHRYELVMDVVTDPSEQSLLIGARYVPLAQGAGQYRVFALFNPSINNSGQGDSCKFTVYNGQLMFLSWDNNIYCAMACNRSVPKYECGFCGKSDGWTDLVNNHDLTFGYNQASGGDVTGIIEISLLSSDPTTLVTISFGQTETEALARAYRTVSKNIASVSAQFIAEWKAHVSWLETAGSLTRITQGLQPDAKRLAYVSTMVISASEDTEHRGAAIASPSIPWGDCAGDANQGGYHLVWGRDLYNMASAAMAVGDWDAANNVVKYFDSVLQETNGSMPQNTWIDGTHYWSGEQLDETGYPIILAWRLKKEGRLNASAGSDIFTSLVAPAADFLSSYERNFTQDRWEEVWGRSPFAIAVVVSALVVAAKWAEERGQTGKAAQWRAKAMDFAVTDLNDCFITRGQKRFYTRNLNTWDSQQTASMEFVDAGFLELVRLGVKSPASSKIIQSVSVADQCIRKDIAGKPYFYRYRRHDLNDGLGKDTYGEKDDGHCWTGDGSGRGRLWPLLSGERGHYELMKANNAAAARIYIDAIAASANRGFMIAEQIWDGPTVSEEHGAQLTAGKGTKSATPLIWSHAEYLKLLRSVADNAAFDRLPEVTDYCTTAGLFMD